MWQLGSAWDDVETLARTWRSADPFPHLVFDEVVPPERVPELFAILEQEPVESYAGEIFAFDATDPAPKTDEFRALRDSFARAFAPKLARITGKELRRVELRAYAYRVGHYLLPHSDHRQEVGRALAFAYYLPSPEPPTGGELELFRCRMEGDEIVSTESAKLIEPVGNRLVVFEVGDASLHQVCEVVEGLRISLSGWFYP